MNLANEGLEARKKEDEVLAKKRKAEDDKVWEGMRKVSSLSIGILIAILGCMIRHQRTKG